MKVNSVTVAVPVLNGGGYFKELLAAVAAQENAAGVELDLLVCDSGSTDGSIDAARAAGARVIEIDKRDFQHGRTRNLLVKEARGDVVALLTDDAVPTAGWLDAIVEGFEAAEDVALVFGPQLARPEHSHIVKRELQQHFASWQSAAGGPLVQRIEADAAGSADYAERKGWYVFFSDANGALAKRAWLDHPYREVPYAEDQLLARELLEAGYAKVFHPGAAVVHSHEYGVLDWYRRYFDDMRGLLEVMGHRSDVTIRSGARSVIGLTRQDRAWLRDEGAGRWQLARATLRSLRQHSQRVTAEYSAARADRLPVWLTARMSLEGRGGAQLHW